MMSNLSKRVGLLTCAALVGVFVAAPVTTQAQTSNAPAATSGGMCVPSDVQATLAQCPSGVSTARSQGGDAPRSQLRAAVPQSQQQGAQPARGPAFELDQQTRMNRERVQTRQYELLQRQVRTLKRLVQNTRRDNPQRPEILLRLAETHFEMQTALNTRVRSFDEPVHQACEVRRNQGNCREQQQAQAAAQTELDTVRQDTIRAYLTLVNDHPDFGRMDEVLFSLAYGLEELHDQERARQVYHRLITGYPESRFIPNAYLSFAEFYFNEQQMEAALRFYGQVTQFPPERNPVYGYALYKSAWAHYNEENYQEALEAFVRTIEFATQNPNATDAANLARQARRELVLPYGQVGSPSRALEFFRRYAENGEQAFDMLEKLAELYFDTGQWESTIAVYHQLMSEQSASDRVCYWQSRVSSAVISSQPPAEQVREVRRMVDIYDAYIAAGNHAAEAVASCKGATAQTLAWLATSWHREAIGTQEQPGTNNRDTLRRSAALYELLVQKFPDLESLEFPEINREDWPTSYKVAYYYAELLWKMEDWARCGPAFDRVVDLNPSGEFTSDAAYASVLCYNNLYEAQYQSRERQTRETAAPAAAEGGGRRRGRRGRRAAEPAPETTNNYAAREFTPLEQGMLGAFQRYLCVVENGDDVPQIKYRRARIYYEANHFEEASVIFRDIAFNHPRSELAEYAANLYLDSLNVLGSMREPPRTECIQDLKSAIQPLTQLHCADQAARDSHPDLCGQLQKLECNAIRLEAQAEGAAGRHKRAAAIYVRIFRRHQACAEVADFAMDEVLWNAAIHFEAARLLGRTIQVRNVLIERFAESEYAKKSIYMVGANFHALAYYEQAATYYERFARQYAGENGSSCTDTERQNSTCPIAHEALQNAVLFRLGLGQTEQAVEDAELFERNYGRSFPRETAQVNFAIGSTYEAARDWNMVARHFRDFGRDFRRSASPNLLIRANVLLGKAAWETDDKRSAERFFREAVSQFRGAPAAITALDVDDASKIRFTKEALDAAAEALFYLAELKYAEFTALRFPRYSGGRSLERINRWAQSEFMTWIQAKQRALAAAEAEYNKIAELQVPIREGLPPLTSPAWLIASASRIGQMYISIIDGVQEAPIPEEIEADPELFGIYVGAFDEPLEPVRAQAMDKFEFCLRTATNVRWFNQYSNTCESELNRLDPRRFPMGAELRSNATFAYGGVGRPGAVELVNTEDEADLGGNGGETAAGATSGGAQ